jgi:predicted permease
VHLQATTLEAGMPPQLFIFTVADRFGFDTDTLAVAIVWLTAISFFSVPLVYCLTG